MRLGTVSQQPGERKSYSFVYDEALDFEDEISSVESCIAEPSDMIAVSVLATEKRVRIFCSGGVDGAIYKITVKVLTAGGEILEDELMVRVKDV